MFKKSLIGLLSLVMFGQAAFGCDQPVTYVLVGKPAPCTGYLFSPEKEKALRLEDEEYQFDLQLIQLKDQQIGLYKQEVTDLQDANAKEQQKSELWRKAAEDSTTKYVAIQERQGTRDLIFTILGVVLTVAAGYALGAAGSAHK
jgi:hypothetical protein